VSVLNTGHLGYSPEQYYHTLVEYAGKFRPHFVIVAVFANDFGGTEDVMRRGKGDWDEAAYWLDEIRQFCRTRQVLCFITAVPADIQLVLPRKDGFYPGLAANHCNVAPIHFYNPLDDFINEDIRLHVKAKAEGRDRPESLLFNTHIGDRHFSPQGSALWARIIGQRLVLLREHHPFGWPPLRSEHVSQRGG
jgi:hypothetical protein